MFPNDEAIYAFMEMSKKLYYDQDIPDDTFRKKVQKKLEEALKNALLMVEHEPENAGYWNILGSLFLRQKQYQKAIDCFNKAIEIAPTYKAFWNNLSIVYYQIGEKSKALECFKEGLLLEKEFGSILTEGPEFVLQGKSLDDYLKEKDQYSMETIDPLDVYYLGLLALHYINNKKPTCAIKSLLRLIRFEPKNPYRYYQMASCLWKINEETRAINFLKKGLLVNPDDKSILDTLVDIYFKQWNFQEAKKYLRQLLEIEPNDTETILDLAAAHAELQEKEKTIYYLKKCLDINPLYVNQIIRDLSFIPYLNYLEENII